MKDVLPAILQHLRQDRGLDFSGYNQAVVQRRIRARMARVRDSSPDDYLRRLRSDPEESGHLVDTLAVNVSGFFRDPLMFELLARVALPQVLDDEQQELRCWAAGCAAGEEAFSLAMLLREALGDALESWQVLIFGTDIDGQALRRGAEGVFSRDSLAQVRLALVDRYFVPEGDRFRLVPEIHGMVRLSRDDLTAPDRLAPADSIFGDFDIILCRNVLIYFSRDLQLRVLSRLVDALAPGGYLVLGESESIPPESSGALEAVDPRARIFRKIVGT